MEGITVEQELQARIFMHKVAITKACYIRDYINKELGKGGILLPISSLEQIAENIASHWVYEVLRNGKLDCEYEQAWERLGNLLPDDYSIIEVD